MNAKRLIYKYIILLIVLLSSFFPAVFSQDLRLNQLGQAEGLSNLLNVHFNVDREGFFFASSRDGLNRYDGSRVKVFRPRGDSISAEANVSSEVFMDENSNRWFSTNNALHCLVSGTDSVYSRSFSQSENSYHYLFHLEAGRELWFVANKHLYKWLIDRPGTEPEPVMPYDTYLAYWLTGDEQGVDYLIRPLLALRSGIEITEFRDGEMERVDSFFTAGNRLGQPALDIAFLEIESTTSIWLPVRKGLVHFNPEKPWDWKLYKHQQKLPRFGYEDAANWDEQYLLVVGIGSGLLTFDKNKGEFVQQDSLFWVGDRILKLDQFNRVKIDDSDNLWLSSFEKGIYHCNLKQAKFQFISTGSVENGQEEFKVKSIVEQEGGEILFNTKQGTLFAYHPKESKGQLARTRSGVVPGRVRFLYQDNISRLWMLSDDEIRVFPKNELGNDFIQIDLGRTEEVIEIGNGVFLSFDFRKVHQIVERPAGEGVDVSGFGPTVRLPSRLFFDSGSGIFFLTQGNNTFRLFKADEDFREIKLFTDIGIVRGLSPAVNDRSSWLATSTGLYRFDPGSLRMEKMMDKERRLDQAFTDVVEDSLGFVWLSSYNGIFRYFPDSQQVNLFTQSDGLRTMQYVENSSLYSRDGKIYFGGGSGLTVIDPKEVHLNEHLPEVNLVRFEINDQDMDRRAFLESKLPIKLKHDQNSLLFDFSIIEYADPTRNLMKYLLVRNDRDTVSIDFENPVRFNLLPPGQYRLDVYAANSDEVWTSHPKSYSFDVRPPWYQTTVARIAGVLLLLGSGYLFYRDRIERVKKRAAYEQKEAEFKQKEAEYKQLAAETETAVLRLQMNPHFIFNSMNSISSYILQKDIDRANEYLHRFSRLMRTILERSEETFSDLAEEIELLTLYLETEAMRFGKKLDFSFQIQDGLDPYDVLIPTMILQPFIENAIWHGLSLKREGGAITVRFRIEGGRLHCEVEDDGVGRSFHAHQTKAGHTSKALTITRRRLELLSREHPDPAHFKIVDLVDPEGDPAGTRVLLVFPLFDVV